jgi:DNA-binding XRE family transcriptional regulator
VAGDEANEGRSEDTAKFLKKSGPSGSVAISRNDDSIGTGVLNQKGLSQDDLACEAQVSRSYLSQLQKGTYFASLKIVGRLAQALAVDPAELLKTSRFARRALSIK